MPKRKDSMALFEAISKSRDKQSKTGFVAPTWLAEQAQQAMPGKSQEQAPAATETQQPPKTGPQQLPVPVTPTPQRQRASVWSRPSDEPVVDSRLLKLAKLATQYPRYAALAAGLVVLVIVAIIVAATLAGRTPSHASAPQGDTQSAQATAGADSSAQASLAVSTERVKGKHYLVIQVLGGASLAYKAEAQKIVDFLSQRGEAATIELTDGGKKLAVWSLHGFDATGSEQAKEFALKIEELGREYQSQGGDYRFQQRPKPTAELLPWYIQQP